MVLSTSKNCRIWGTENPHAVREQEGLGPSMTVWCGVSAKGIVGPFFFEERRRPATVAGPRYHGLLLRDQVVPALQNLGIPLNRIWFQQDGASPHTSRAALNYLKATFPGKVLSTQGGVAWHPRSTDLTICDFFFCGFVKTKVTNPQCLASCPQTPDQRSGKVCAGERTSGCLQQFFSQAQGLPTASRRASPQVLPKH